jgi:hypothetical protein
MGAIDVGNEMSLEARGGIRGQGFRDEGWTEIRAADADVHDIGEGVIAEARELARTHSIAEFPHPGERSHDFGVDVVASRQYGAAGAQGGVQHGAILREIDPLALEHARCPLGQLALPGKIQEEAHRIRIDQVL